MATYDGYGNLLTSDSVDARALVLSTDFQGNFAENFSAFAPDFVCYQTKGKAIYIAGDSLHDYAGGDGFTRSGFVTDWNAYLKFAHVSQLGYAGSTWSGQNTGDGIQRITELVSSGVVYDTIILAYGGNEDAGGRGTLEDAASNAEGCTMVSAIKWCIEQIQSTFPSTALGIVVPPPKFTNTGADEYDNLIVGVCEEYHIPYFDMRTCMSVTDLASDGCHLGVGAFKYGCGEAKLILDITPYRDTIYNG